MEIEMTAHPPTQMLSEFTFEDAESIYEEVMSLVSDLADSAGSKEAEEMAECIAMVLRRLHGFAKPPEE